MQPCAQKSLCIFASELSGLVGRNRFVSIPEAIEKLVCRIQGRPTQTELFEMTLSPAQKKIVYMNVDNTRSAKDVDQNLKTISDSIEVLDVPSSQKQALWSCAERIQKTEFGTRNEKRVCSSTEAKRKIAIIKDDRFHKRLFFSANDTKVYVGGRFDGVYQEDGEKVVVEIKSRVKKLFGTVPEYEQVQLCAYMFILDARKGLLVERFCDEQNELRCDFDPELWHRIESDLKETLLNHKIV